MRKLVPAVAFELVARPPVGTVEHQIAEARRHGPTSREGKTCLIMAEAISYAEQRVEAEAAKAAAIAALCDHLAVPAGERQLWQSTISSLAGTEALRAKLPEAPVLPAAALASEPMSGDDPNQEREQLAQAILTDRNLRPPRFDQAMTEPVLVALLAAVKATNHYRIVQLNEMEKADAANSRVHASVRFGRSDEVRPLIEAAQRRIDDLQRQYDGLPDPMAASRDQRRQVKADAHQAQIDLERLAAQQEQEKRRLDEQAARREKRREVER